MKSTLGEILRDEFLEPMGVAWRDDAMLRDIVEGEVSVTVREAEMLSRMLGTTPEFWMGLVD